MISHHFGGGVYAKETRIPAGYTLGQHVHLFDHLSILASGTAEISVDSETTQHTGPACLVIKAGKQHEVHALTDVIWYCVHATDCTDPETVDEVLIVKEA